MSIQLKRAYEKASESDGTRILVDRLWPRGVSREDARIDEWKKEIAPSDALRKWFGHEPAKWKEFEKRYFKELDAHRDAVAGIAKRARRSRVTIVFGARDEEHNNAVAIKDYIESRDL